VFQGWSRLIEQALREAQQRGDITTTADAAQLARFVLNAWQGTLVRMKVVKSDQPFEDFEAVVFGHLLR
jgi:TetR/AcrR family transcriptional repressor of nem operon